MASDVRQTQPLSPHAAHYPFVDVLRGIASSLVLVFHGMHVSGRTNFPPDGVWRFLDYGWVGVNIFLLISGFVITLSAFRHLDRHPQAFRRPFAVARLARIVPLYLLTGAVFLAVADPPWLHGPLRDSAVQVGAHLAFVHNLSPTTHGSIDGPNWSIALEMQFYVFMLLLAPWLVRRAAPLHLVVAIVFAAIFRYATTLWAEPGRIDLQFIYATEFPGLIDHFALGIALAFAAWPAPERGSVLVPGWRVFTIASAAALALLWLAGSVLVEFGYWEDVGMVTLLPTLLALGFTAALVAAIAFPAAAHPAFRPLRYLGEISYGLYLWHMPVILFMLKVAPDLKGGPFLVALFLLTLLLSALSWHLFEKPLSRIFRRSEDAPGGSEVPQATIPVVS